MLELEARVPWVPHPDAVCLECLFRTWGGSSERSFLNRLVVREVTVQVHWLSLPGLELAKRFVCQIGKRVLGGGECRRPTLFCIELGEKKRIEGILLRVGLLYDERL